MKFFSRYTNKDPSHGTIVLREGLLPDLFNFNHGNKIFLKITENLTAEQVDMQMMHRLSAVKALIDDHAIAVF